MFSPPARTARKRTADARAAETFTRAQMAAMFGVRPDQWRKRYEPLVPAAERLRTGQQVRFRPTAVRGLVDAMLAEAAAKRTPLGTQPGEPETASPALERWRNARADMAELDLRTRIGELVDRNDLRAALAPATQELRRAVRVAQRQAPHVAELIARAIAEADRAVAHTVTEINEPEQPE